MKPLFNPTASTFMHIDLNSCFASIEQQANPFLRGKPIAICAYTTPRGCILAPSIEAKEYGVKTGMRLGDGQKLCPHLIPLPSDPQKYRFINKKFQILFSEYSPHVSVRSIDEMLLDFKNLPILESKTMKKVGKEIKLRIKQEIGEWLRVSIGISTNPYLSKVAAGLHKPDGLDEINQYSILQVLSQMKLVDLPYIKERNALRLNRVGIYTPLDFYHASPKRLKSAFQSINGEYWYLRLHGHLVDHIEWSRKTIGHSYALPKFTANRVELERLLYKLVVKMGKRIRKNKLTVHGIHLGLNFANGQGYWHKGKKFPIRMYSNQDLFRASSHLLDLAQPLKPVRVLAVSSFNLEEDLYSQMELFIDEAKKRKLAKAIDSINERWGEFIITPAIMMDMDKTIVDRISFGGVRDMPKVVISSGV